MSDARVAAEGRARVATLPRPRPFAQVAGGRAPAPLGPRSPRAMHRAIRHINAVTLAVATSRTCKNKKPAWHQKHTFTFRNILIVM